MKKTYKMLLNEEEILLVAEGLDIALENLEHVEGSKHIKELSELFWDKYERIVAK